MLMAGNLSYATTSLFYCVQNEPNSKSFNKVRSKLGPSIYQSQQKQPATARQILNYTIV